MHILAVISATILQKIKSAFQFTIFVQKSDGIFPGFYPLKKEIQNYTVELSLVNLKWICLDNKLPSQD